MKKLLLILALVVSLGALFLLRWPALPGEPAAALADSHHVLLGDVVINVTQHWEVALADIRLADGVTLTFTCTPGNAAGEDGDEHGEGEDEQHGHGEGEDDQHGNGGGEDDQHGNDEGGGGGQQHKCPAKINVTVTARDIGGAPLATASRTGVSVPGSAFFDFVPDVAIAPIRSITVTATSP